MEKKTTIKVPEAYVPLLEDIRLLTADQNNPNCNNDKAARANLEKPAKIRLDLPHTHQQRRRLVLMVSSGLKSANNMASFLLQFCVCRLAMLIGGCLGRF